MKYIFISEDENFPGGPKEDIGHVTLHKKEELAYLINKMEIYNSKNFVVTCNNGTEEHPDIINIASVQTIAGKRYVIGPV